MDTSKPSKLEMGKACICRSITLSVFLMLPKKVTEVFTNLSIMYLILQIQNKSIDKKCSCIEKLENLLKISINKDVLLFPKYSVKWFWTKAILDKVIYLNETPITLYDAIHDEEIFKHHARYIIGVLIESLPRVVKYKLNLQDKLEIIKLKHNVMRSLIYS